MFGVSDNEEFVKIYKDPYSNQVKASTSFSELKKLPKSQYSELAAGFKSNRVWFLSVEIACGFDCDISNQCLGALAAAIREGGVRELEFSCSWLEQEIAQKLFFLLQKLQSHPLDSLSLLMYGHYKCSLKKLSKVADAVAKLAPKELTYKFSYDNTYPADALAFINRTLRHQTIESFNLDSVRGLDLESHRGIIAALGNGLISRYKVRFNNFRHPSGEIQCRLDAKALTYFRGLKESGIKTLVLDRMPSSEFTVEVLQSLSHLFFVECEIDAVELGWHNLNAKQIATLYSVLSSKQQAALYTYQYVADTRVAERIAYNAQARQISDDALCAKQMAQAERDAERRALDARRSEVAHGIRDDSESVVRGVCKLVGTFFNRRGTRIPLKTNHTPGESVQANITLAQTIDAPPPYGFKVSIRPPSNPYPDPL